MNELITSNAPVTMSSIDLVEFINSQKGETEKELRHDNFMAKVPKVLGEDAALGFKGSYLAKDNTKRPCYFLPKREACLMAMSYSYELQAKVFDRMTELEAKQAKQFNIPTTLSGALRLAAEQAEVIEQQQAQLEAAKPAIAFVERYVEARSSKSLSDVAKVLGHKPQAFIKTLADENVLFKRGGSWIPYQTQIDNGRFTVHTGESNGHAFMQTRVEPKGVEWLARVYG